LTSFTGIYFIGPDLLTACVSTNSLLAFKSYCQDLLKTHSMKLAMKCCGHR